jgi:hypothetical protein
MTLSVERHGDGVRVAVQDASPVAPVPRRHSDMATTGRGLHLLDELADEWAVEDAPSGKTIWFTLTADREASQQQDASRMAGCDA